MSVDIICSFLARVAGAKSMSAIDLASAAGAAGVLFFDGQRDDDHAVVLNTNFCQRL